MCLRAIIFHFAEHLVLLRMSAIGTKQTCPQMECSAFGGKADIRWSFKTSLDLKCMEWLVVDRLGGDETGAKFFTVTHSRRSVDCSFGKVDRHSQMTTSDHIPLSNHPLLARALATFNRIGALPAAGTAADEDRAGCYLLVEWMRELPCSHKSTPSATSSASVPAVRTPRR